MARKNRTKLITLDETTWELALKKSNFSGWVRGQLRSERNKTEVTMRRCTYCMKQFPKKDFYDHVCVIPEMSEWDVSPIQEEEE